MDKDSRNDFNSNSTILNCILVFLLVILFSSGSSITLSQLWGGILAVPLASEVIQIVAVIVICLMLVLKKSRIKLQSLSDLFWLFMPFILFILSLIAIGLSVETTIDVGTTLQTSIHVFIMFFLLAYCKKSYSKFNSEIVSRFVVILGTIEAILGIYQHVANNTFFDATSLNAIYFLNGLSSSNILFLNAGASVRAFGTFDSGLSLGIFLMMCLSITIDFTNFNNKIKVIMISIFLLAIYFTLTRNVYIGFGIFVYIYISMKLGLKNIGARFLYLLVTLISATLFWLSNLLDFLITFAGHVNISTFGARFIYMKMAISRIPDILHFMFGSNIKSERSLPIDSTVIAIIAQYGIIFTFITLLILYLIFKSIILVNKNGKIRYPAIGAFLLVLPIIGASNSLLTAFLMVSSIVCLLFNAKIELGS